MRLVLRPGLDIDWGPGLMGPEGLEGGWVSGTQPPSPICPTLQGRAPRDASPGDPGCYYDKAAGKCYHRCPAGESGAGAGNKGGLGSGKDGTNIIIIMLIIGYEGHPSVTFCF